MWHKQIQTLLLIVYVAFQVHALVQSPPRIIKQPPTDEILFQVAEKANEAEKPFYIECEAEGEPAPKYRWIKNGQEFKIPEDRMQQQPGRGTLIVTKPRDGDKGHYQCFAENGHGIATSNSVFVRKAELNKFVDEAPRSIAAVEGEPFTLKCHPPPGWPKPSLSWIFERGNGLLTIDNNRMTVDSEGNLHFTNVTRSDASDGFLYACVATQYLSEFRKEYQMGGRVVFEVQPTEGPKRIAPRKQFATTSEVALRGKRVELFCIYGGTPLPKTIWFKDGKPVEWNDRVIQGNYGKSLVIRHAVFEDAGSYSCQVSNGVGSTESSSMSLRVNAVPYFTVEPDIKNAAEEEQVEFRCEASGVPEPTIRWIYNGRPISEAPSNSRRRIETNRIIISSVSKEDTGNYGCNASNALGYVYRDVYLNVLTLPPEITEPPRPEATVDNRDVTLRCRNFGVPKPKVKWMRNGSNEPLTGNRYEVQDNGDLVIHGAKLNDAGEYTCKASNKLGDAEATGSLIVKEHTRITDEPQDSEIAAGNQGFFRCIAKTDESLELEIEWYKDDMQIDFENEPRFSRGNDNSLTVSRTVDGDSGRYTCVAKTELDEVRANAKLLVIDVPNAPKLNEIHCGERDATISWEPTDENHAPILHYEIQSNTPFTPEAWNVAQANVPAKDFTNTIPMTPWANYTFRVVAYNKVGPSPPSQVSDTCVTKPDVPFSNPKSVKGEGTTPSNMIISWNHMPQIEHNGPGFHYRVHHKRDVPKDDWIVTNITNWQQEKFEITEQPTFARYKIKVTAHNANGNSNVAAEEIIGYSGEDWPTEAPGNFTMIQVTGSTSALLSWNPVSIDSIRGHFKGYKVQTWTDIDGKENLREIHVKGDTTQALVTKFRPDSVNYAQVLAFNSRYHGPPSAVIDFKTPEGVPSSVQALEVHPLGSSGFLLRWQKPANPNGRLTGYRVYYAPVDGTAVGQRIQRSPQINDSRATQAKVSGLKADTKYRVYIAGTTKAGEGEDYFVEQRTLPAVSVQPSQPSFTWEQLPLENGLAPVRINWMPHVEGAAGTHFYAKYRLKDDSEWTRTDEILEDDHIVVNNLQPDEKYEFAVVSVDGEYATESQPQEISTSVDDPKRIPSEDLAAAGWLTGMLLAIAFLLLLLIIVCIIKRNRGGKYDVYDREMAAGRRDYPEEGFHEYSQPQPSDSSNIIEQVKAQHAPVPAKSPKLDNKSAGGRSIASNLMKADDEVDDGDSMAAYNEGDTGQFAEDGSFIGQYVPGKLNPPVSPPSVHLQTVSSNQHLTSNGIGSNNGAIATYV